ncbi:LysR family transcriptional regulator [Psychromonas aquatilis]|uniref:LysR family transcriptional regulator n=1 Tax=Psychromonas aquatilis TaxID=2005072 RepID=A0ABU9GU67_9GAMM
MKAKYSLDDLRYFCIIASLSSFKKAAKKLDIPLSTLSRRVRQLETDLQLRLLERNAHRVTLTHIGEQYYARYKGLFEQVDNIELDLDNEKNQAKGQIRVTAPIYLGQQILSEIFCDFLADYPEIQLDLRFSNDLVDIEALGIDVAFRVRNSTIDNWVARELKLTGNILCCNAAIDLDYLVRPEQLNDVKKVTCIGLKPWKLENSSTGEQYQYNPEHQICLETDEIQMMINAVKAGLGVSYVPDYIAYPLIKQGKLKQVLPGWKSPEQVISILYRDRVNIPLRVRLLIEYVLKRLH